MLANSGYIPVITRSMLVHIKIAAPNFRTTKNGLTTYKALIMTYLTQDSGRGELPPIEKSLAWHGVVLHRTWLKYCGN
jgi:hypothetical protein